MKNCAGRPEPLDLERDLPTTREDVAALAAVRRLPVSAAAYEQFLRSLGDLPYDALLARRGPHGELFEL